MACDVARSLSHRTRDRIALVAGLAAAAITGTRGDAVLVLRERGQAIGAADLAEVVASGFERLSGIAVDPNGAVWVTDRRAGTLTRIGADGIRSTVLDNLQTPGAVAADNAGSLFVIEDGRHILRLGVDGTISAVAAPVRRARALAIGPDGRLYMSTRM